MKKTIITENKYNATKLYAALFETEKEHMACTYVDFFDHINTEGNYLDFIMDVIIDGFELDR